MSSLTVVVLIIIMERSKVNLIVGILTALEQCEKNNQYNITLDNVTLNIIHDALLYYLEAGIMYE
jgi:hypothetical protein